MEFVRTQDWNKAIMKAYGYNGDEKDLSQKIYQAKKTILRKAELQEILASIGIDNVTVGRGLHDLIDANKPVIYRGRLMKDDSNKTIELPDWNARYNGLKLAADMLGMVQKQQAFDIVRQQNNLIVYVENERDAKKRIHEAEQRKKTVEVGNEAYEVEGED